MPSRLKIAINDDAKAFLESQAAKQNVSGPDIVRKALEAYRYLQEVRDTDGKVVLRRADGDLENLIGL